MFISVPTAVPGNFELDESKEFSYRSASFKWDGVDESPNAMKGNFEGYEIRYWKGEMPEKVKVISIKPSQMGSRRGKRAIPKKVTATVSNLPPFSELYLEVVARNRFFESNASNQINITTPEGGRYWQCTTAELISVFYYIPLQQSLGGGVYWFHHCCLSVRPSVCLLKSGFRTITPFPSHKFKVKFVLWSLHHFRMITSLPFDLQWWYSHMSWSWPKEDLYWFWGQRSRSNSDFKLCTFSTR